MPVARWQKTGASFISSPIAGRGDSLREWIVATQSYHDKGERETEPPIDRHERNVTKRNETRQDETRRTLHTWFCLHAPEDPVTRVPHYIHDGPPGTRTITSRHGQRNRKSHDPHPKIPSRSENTDTSLIIWPPPPARSICRREVVGAEWERERRARIMRVTKDGLRALAQRMRRSLSRRGSNNTHRTDNSRYIIARKRRSSTNYARYQDAPYCFFHAADNNNSANNSRYYYRFWFKLICLQFNHERTCHTYVNARINAFEKWNNSDKRLIFDVA